MIHLISDPPALYLPKIYLFGDPQHMDMTIRRSDGKGNVVCNVEIPDALTEAGFLKVKNKCCRKMILDIVSSLLIHRFAEMLDVFRILYALRTRIPEWHCQFNSWRILSAVKRRLIVSTRGQRLNPLSGGIPLVITNIGKTELRIFELII